MNALFSIAASWHEVIALVLLHFVWQAFAIALLVELAVRGLRIKNGTPRYTAYLLAFFCLAACPAITLIYLSTSATQAIVSAGMLPVMHDQATSWSLGLAHIVRPYSAWITAGWIAGVALLAVRFFGSAWALYRLRTSLQSVAEPVVQHAAQIASRLGLHRSWELRTSTSIREPLTFGWLRPIIVVPISLLTAQPPEILDAVLAHELAHIRRYDLWVNAFQRLIESVLFFHPVVWWLSLRVRQQRELCCDDMAVRLTGEPIAYVTALERVAAIRIAGNVAPLAVAMGAGVLSYRVRRVLGLADPAAVEIAPSPRLLVAGAALCGAILLLSTGGAEWIGRQVVSPTPDKNQSQQLVALDSADDKTSPEEESRDTTSQQVDQQVELPAATKDAPKTGVLSKTQEIDSADEVQVFPAKRTLAKVPTTKPLRKRFDLNSDGKLDAAERQAIKTAYAKKMKQRSQQWLAKYDTNKDGQLDSHEKAAAWAKYRRPMHHRSKHRPHSDSKHARHFDHRHHGSDRHHPDKMHSGDRKPNDRHSYSSRYQAWRKQLLAKYDKDQSGSLESAERESMVAAWKERRKQQWKEFIDRYDMNGDGELDEHERMAIRLSRQHASFGQDRHPGSS